MPRKKIDRIKRLAQAKNQFIVDQLQKFEALIKTTGSVLTQDILSDFVDQLDVQNGQIANSQENIQKVALLEKVFRRFEEQDGIRIINAFVADLSEIVKLGKGYYTELIPDQVKGADIDRIINQKLGLTWQEGKWSPKQDGYVHALMTSPTIRTEIKKLSYNNIIGKAGPKALRETIKGYIEGIGEKKGAHYKFYETYAFDTYSEIDRLNSKLHADRLKLRYFLFNGGIIADSRIFCVEHSGKCWSTEEAEKWRDLIGKYRMVPGKRKALIKAPIGPIVEDASTYNPLVHLGGIKCRHSADYVSDEIALELRGDLQS